MQTRNIFIFSILTMLVFAGTASAGMVSYTDTVNYWRLGDDSTSLNAFRSSRSSQNSKDVNGIPDFLGGSVSYGSGRTLTGFDLYYTTNGHDVSGYRAGGSNSFYERVWHEQLRFGDLFIDVFEGNNDWDYIVRNDVVYDVRGLDYGYTDDIYIKTTAPRTRGPRPAVAWDGEGTPRKDHPVYLKDELFTAATSLGRIDTSGWVTEIDPITGAAHAYWMFNNPDINIEIQSRIMFALTTNCANDVLLTSVPIPAPEPSTFLLLLAGLAGTGILVRRSRN